MRRPGFSLAWSPDSRALAYVEGSIGLDVADTGDVRIVTLAGRDREAIDAADAYGGQIEAVAWTRVPTSTVYRPPEAASGVYAGGPVAHLASDKEQVAFAACLHVFAWAPTTDALRQVDDRSPQVLGAPSSGCVPREGRAEIYDLAIAGDRIAWAEKTTGLTYTWSLRQATLAPSVAGYALASGRNSLGSHFNGAGALAGAGSTLLYSVWNTQTDVAGGALTAATLFRATPAGCPCPAIGYAAVAAGGREVFLTPIVALDTDGMRVAASRFDRLVLLDASGTDLLSLSVNAAAAQLAGDDLVVAIPNEVRVYDAESGQVRHTWPLPSASVGRDCRFYSEPRCPYEAELQLQDAAHGLATYVFNGRVHVIRLVDGRDADVGLGTEARFVDTGLVYVDGARIRLLPYASLPLD